MHVEYKLFFKGKHSYKDAKWEFIFFEAESDFEATMYAGKWAAEHKPERYGLEKIMTVRLI